MYIFFNFIIIFLDKIFVGIEFLYFLACIELSNNLIEVFFILSVIKTLQFFIFLKLMPYLWKIFDI